MLKKLKIAWQLWRYLGASWIFFRLKYALQMRLGVLRRRMPSFEWDEHPLSTWLRSDIPSTPAAYLQWRQKHQGRFFFDDLPKLPSFPAWDTRRAIEEADRALAGQLRYFQHTDYRVGFPPDWQLNPMTGQRIPADSHWTQISDFGQGDIKLVWEASRFGIVFTLVRAYVATKDERYPEAFWSLVEDWAVNNPPNVGPNWKCGQEAAFRVMAWCLGLYSFLHARSTTSEQVAFLATMIAAHGERIEQNIGYARSQKNNHAISEAVGLWTIGLLFPEFKRADHWRQQGQRIIQAEVHRQIYDDGAYVQHSMNYHRVMLHDLLWALRLGEINDQKLPEAVYSKFEKAVCFLYQLLDLESGQVPNHGANDGALVLPLNTCDYVDYRPVLQASHYLLKQQKLFQSGPWDEDLLWLFGSEALNNEREETTFTQTELAAPIGGYYTLRSNNSWAMIHCAEYRDRPSHADQLHLDLWWRGINIACDAGTYFYNAEDPWNNGLSGTQVHNTVWVDGQDQMPRASRFLWLDWAQGIVTHHTQSESGHVAYWEGIHTGYTRLDSPVMHQRGVVRLGTERWLIMDMMQSDSEHDYVLQWLLSDFPRHHDENLRTVTLDTPHGPYQICTYTSNAVGQFSIERAAANSVRGWRSCYYAHKELALSLALHLRDSNVHFFTLFSPPDIDYQVSKGEIIITWPNQEANIALASETSLVHSISLNGAITDHLEMLG